ncbi:MAG: DNA-3-methyladenine glycosylase [Candidatus Limnocylindrales bacterium]|jgi:DNA-3-methyladenine glycosylase
MSEPRVGASRPLPRQLLATDTDAAARRLIGARLVTGRGPDRRIGRIVEVEAYVGQEDLASHARFGRTRRNAAMFGPPGLAYVYLVYGMYHCLNVVTEAEGRPAALLVRAVDPIAGMDEMRAARIRWARGRPGRSGISGSERAGNRIEALPNSQLASGPGLVCAAFSVDSTANGVDLCDACSELRLEEAEEDGQLPLETAARTGIDYAPDPWRSLPWRFFVPGNAAVSSVPPRSRRRVAP